MKRLILLVICLALPAFADVTVTSVSDKDGQPWSVTYIAGGKIRAEILRGAEQNYMLWQVGSQQMTVVVPKEKSYMVMDKAQIAASIGSLLLELSRDVGSVLICVTHSADLAARFPRRAELRDGRLTSL